MLVIKKKRTRNSFEMLGKEFNCQGSQNDI